MNGSYPNAFYRASVKAFVYDADGKVLAVKENGDKWSLPGGGVDHGETPLEALKRELAEELGMTDAFTAEFVGVDTYFYEPKDAWLMWIMYELKFQKPYAYGVTDEIGDAQFIEPSYFEEKQLPYQKVINKWIKKKSPR